MNPSEEEKLRLSRRRFLSCGFMAVAGAGLNAQGAPLIAANDAIEPFYGAHQGGILTPLQHNTYFAAFDLVTDKRDDVVQMLQTWTAAAARMSTGQTAKPLGDDDSVPASDSGDALGLSPARLTITFGFGAGLFTKDGKDRYGLASRRPEALVDLPKFVGDQLADARTGGDISVQACADDPQVAFHAIRQLARLSYGAAELRWVQSGFTPQTPANETPRNLMGFKDGTKNPSVKDPKTMDQFIWVGDEGPNWMQGGSYLVVRRIRIALEHWDRMNLAFQEQTVGRHKYSGAPLGGKKEFDKADYDATDSDGNPIIPENSHIRLGAAEKNAGAQILRRPYSYNDGANITAERWPPWRDEMEFDAGLFFICYQRDPRTGFIKIFEKMAKFDMMNQFVTHTGGGLFACPGGITEGSYVGQRLFEKT
ncbi:MAG TPA: iron uptake transporter deferrochelatase/peroxidase subunit [Candidatus Acidoferrum sp.]|jgi:deferrochelatase/peroxidase EfeB|nr:iron uptake transporter deferrochelatase/peroxidase subunit [Candidatus Acidoferrum sp.]